MEKLEFNIKYKTVTLLLLDSEHHYNIVGVKPAAIISSDIKNIAFISNLSKYM